MKANWSYPTEIRFGAGRISELADVCAGAGVRRPLFVTDRSLATLPITQQALKLVSSSAVLFSDVSPNPKGADVAKGVALYQQEKCDGVIGFGGGSALDTAKTIAFMQGQNRPIWDFEDIGDWWTRANADAIAPVIAIPTTAGTGSEVGRASVITKEDSQEKKIIFHPKMLPVVVIADPELTVGLPPVLTAGAGMDALAHCMEAYCAPNFHPMSAGIALEGMRLVSQALVRAVKDGSDIEARSHMLIAASMGAVAFQKGLGAIHSLSHPVGAMYQTHHGMTNAVFMPYVLVYNREVIQGKIGPMCDAIGIDRGFDSLLDWVLQLRQEINVPHTLEDFGVPDDQVDLIAERAVADPSTGTNPRVLDEKGAKQIFLAAHSSCLEF